jgi:ABC-type glycerol-3-phosphate transport system substrate-binding protein
MAVIRIASKLSLGIIVLQLGVAACTTATTLPTPSTEVPLAPSPPALTATPPSEQEQSNASEVLISVWLSWKPAGVRAFNELIQAFQSRFPQVMFSVSYVPAEGLRSAIEEAATSGALPSVFLAPSIWGPELMQAGIIFDVSEQPTDELEAVIHPLAWSQTTSAGQMLGLPVQMHGNVLYRNRGLVSVPAATVEGLVATAQTFRGTTNVGQSLDFGFDAVGPFSLACGGALIQQSAPPDLETDVAPCWLRLLRELSLAGPVGFNTQEDFMRFEAGEAGWLIESTERYDDFRTALGSDAVAVDPWPVYQSTGEPLAGFVWTENAYFTTALQEDEFSMAWAFVTSLLSAQSQAALSNPTGASNLPVHAATVPLVGPPAQMRAAILGGTALPLWSPDPRYMEALERAARAVSVQGAEVETALRRAIDELGDV